VTANPPLTNRQREVFERLRGYSKAALLDLVSRIGVADLDEMEAWCVAMDFNAAAAAGLRLEPECQRICAVVNRWEKTPARVSEAHCQRLKRYGRIVTRHNKLADKCTNLHARFTELDAILQPRRQYADRACPAYAKAREAAG